MKIMGMLVALVLLLLACGSGPKQTPVTTPSAAGQPEQETTIAQPERAPQPAETTSVPAGTSCAESAHYLNTFRMLYGCLGIGGCILCHAVHERTNGSFLNQYGVDLDKAILGGGQEIDAFRNVEALDSDNDGYSNIAEINSGTYPGSAQDHP